MHTADGTVARYRPGDLIAGHLRVEAPLGEGGAGAVYRVRDERRGGRVALKQLHAPEGADKALLTSQFAREYHTLYQLAHPRIIEVYDYGVDGGRPYYTMELLDGQDLRDRGKQSFPTACALLRDVASSLAILHSRGWVHRDVSARNVRCTSDGRAKLIDFGAMVPAGSNQRAVGTPPFVAPEILQLQAVDARADLYSLGALAYYTLTGRHAYPAQTFQQLRDAWRRAPRKPSDYAPDIPEALAELVMSLLRLDRDERPRSAAEVMERLSGIAGLPIAELPEVGRAYLVMPSLVGRATMLQQVRNALLRALRKRQGCALLIEGAPGVGRSRFLDASVLEAKLMGAVVCAAPAAVTQGDYGVARSLLAQLLEALPELCEQTAAPRAALLARVLPSLAPRVTPANAPERRHLQAALRDFFLTITHRKHIVIAVDDVGAIDEPSIAMLGALAHGAQRRRLTLLLTAASSDAGHGVGVLRELAVRITLLPLDAEQTEALLRSLFGENPLVATLAARLHALTGGNPREVIRLCDHLIARGMIHYEAGSWTLPNELAQGDLPRGDREGALRRIAELSSRGRELAEALALTDVRTLSLAQIAALDADGDAGRSFQALDELLQAGILIAEADRYRLPASDLLASLADTMPAQYARTLHARIARVLPAEPRSATRLLHLLRGGQEQDAIAVLLAGEPDELYAGRLEALACAAEAAQRLDLPVRTQLELQYRVARLSALSGRQELFDRYGWPLIERLRSDSGLLHSGELDAALGDRERHAGRQPAEQGFTTEESMLRLVALYGSCNAMAGQALDLEQIERLGSLEPWLHVSRAIRLVQRAIDITRATLVGCFELALRQSIEVFRELDDPEGLDLATARTRRLAFSSAIALIRAADASPTCEDWIAQLDSEPGYRGNAWRFRMLYQLAQGRLERAAEYERRSELLDLQDAGGLAHPVVTSHPELMLHALCDNLTGVKRTLERVARMTHVFPRWSARLSIAQAEYKRLQGDLPGALLALAPALDGAQPGRHPDWSLSRHTQLRLLLGLGRAQEASALGLRYIDESKRRSITGEHLLKGDTAEALAAVGRVGEAERLAEQNLADLRAAEVGGIRLGLAYEVRGRIAIAAKDAASFTVCAERCALEYLDGRSPHLRARYARLLEAAAEAGLGVSFPQIRPDEPLAPLDDDARTVYSRMLTCISPGERAERALQLLLEATGASTGYFYGLRGGKLSLLFSAEAAPASALATLLEDCLEHELGDLTLAPSKSDNELALQPIAAPLSRFIDELGRAFEPLVLVGRHNGEAVIAGVAALHYPHHDRPPPRRAMLDAVIAELIKEDVVDPITCVT